MDRQLVRLRRGVALRLSLVSTDIEREIIARGKFDGKAKTFSAAEGTLGRILR